MKISMLWTFHSFFCIFITFLRATDCIFPIFFLKFQFRVFFTQIFLTISNYFPWKNKMIQFFSFLGYKTKATNP